MIDTVLGPIAATDLGVTYIHEHLYVRPGELPRYEPFTLDSIVLSAREAESFHSAGGATIVDLAPLNFGRDPEALREISLRAGVNVVFVTGFHKDEFLPRWFFDLGDTAIAEVVVREIECGVGVSGSRPGAIKVGTSLNAILPSERRAIGICAPIARDLHVPLITHTDRGTMALEQLEAIRKCGVDLEHVCVSHADLSFDIGYLKRICDTGAFLSFDHVGRNLADGDAECVSLLAELVEGGYGGQVCLAGDMGKKSYLPAYGGAPGLTYILQDLRERLLEAMDEEDFMRMVVDNPCSVLDWKRA